MNLNLKNLRVLVTLRNLQRSEIEMRVAKSSQRLWQLDAQRNTGLDLLVGQMEAWESSLSGSSVGLDFARAWSRAIRDGEAALGAIEDQIAEASTAHAALATAYAAANARADAASQLRDRAARRDRRRREERAMADVSDQRLHRSLQR